MAESPGVKGFPKWGREVLRFGLIFGGCLAVFGVGYVFLRQSSIYDPYLAFNARLSASMLNLFGSATRVDGAMVLSTDFSFRVTAECTSTIFTAILASAVLAWPSSAREKVIGLATGAAILFLMNLVRIVTLFYIGSAFPSFLDIAHFFLWQIALILITVGVWLLWSEKMVRKTLPPATDG